MLINIARSNDIRKMVLQAVNECQTREWDCENCELYNSGCLQPLSYEATMVTEYPVGKLKTDTGFNVGKMRMHAVRNGSRLATPEELKQIEKDFVDTINRKIKEMFNAMG